MAHFSPPVFGGGAGSDSLSTPYNIGRGILLYGGYLFEVSNTCNKNTVFAMKTFNISIWAIV